MLEGVDFSLNKLHYLGTGNFKQIYQINHVFVEALITGQMITSRTNNRPEEVSTQ
jgi:hypothetical protein